MSRYARTPEKKFDDATVLRLPRDRHSPPVTAKAASLACENQLGVNDAKPESFIIELRLGTRQRRSSNQVTALLGGMRDSSFDQIALDAAPSVGFDSRISEEQSEPVANRHACRA